MKNFFGKTAGVRAYFAGFSEGKQDGAPSGVIVLSQSVTGIKTKVINSVFDTTIPLK